MSPHSRPNEENLLLTSRRRRIFFCFKKIDILALEKAREEKIEEIFQSIKSRLISLHHKVRVF
jgi:hypothetical protein